MIGYQLAIQAAHRPTQMALSYGAQHLTYAQLHENACRLANALYADGVRPGDRVAVLLHNCNAFLETLFACALSGAIFVPINFRLVGPEIRYIVENCEARALIEELDRRGGALAAVEPLKRSLSTQWPAARAGSMRCCTCWAPSAA